MTLITHSLDGRKQHRYGLGRRLAAQFLALIWTAVLSFAASSLQAGGPPVRGGDMDRPALNQQLDEKAANRSPLRAGRGLL